jgi:O-antigen/teichoic acid export membrane protein
MTATGLGSGRRLLGRLGGVAGSLVLGQLLVGLTYVLAARSMTPAGLGLIATTFAIGTFSSTIFDMGLTSYLVREVASGKVAVIEARSLLGVKRRAVGLLLVPTMAAGLLIMPAALEGVILGTVGWAVWEAQSANALLRAMERFTPAATAQLAGRLAGLLATVGLLLVGPAELALSVGLVLSFVTEAVIGRLGIGRGGTRPVPSRPVRSHPVRFREMVAIHRHTVSFGLVSLAAIGQQLDTPLVTAGAGATAGGMYAGAGRLLGPLLFLSSSLALVGSPWLARAQHDPAVLAAEERRISRVSLLLALAPLGAAALGPALIPLILGPQYQDTGPTFSILAIGAVLSTISQGAAITLQNRGAERTVATAIGVGLVLGLVATFFLAVAGGPVWAAIGFVLSQTYIVTHLLIARRRTAP